ncbi:uncharacterized protein [Callorhinus ursinus]|uniref:uncharacterized protein n=1 Tax=Callorhinus ursinus TaxID=34884 RepID=UPI003CD01835
MHYSHLTLTSPKSPPPGRKTNRPQTHPSTCSERPKAARQRGDARPHYCARRRALPGALAYLAAVSAPRRPPAGWGAGGARARAGVGAPRRLRPLRRSPGADRRPPAPSGAAGATRLEAKAAGQPGQGPERRRRGRRWEESARGQGGRRQGPGGWTYSCHNCGDEGLRNRFFQKQTENGRMKIQPTSLDRDLLQSISGRRPDHMGTAKSQANSSEWADFTEYILAPPHEQRKFKHCQFKMIINKVHGTCHNSKVYRKKNIVGNNGISGKFFAHDIGQNTYTKDRCCNPASCKKGHRRAGYLKRQDNKSWTQYLLG